MDRAKGASVRLRPNHKHKKENEYAIYVTLSETYEGRNEIKALEKAAKSGPMDCPRRRKVLGAYALKALDSRITSTQTTRVRKVVDMAAREGACVTETLEASQSRVCCAVELAGYDL